MIASSAPYSVTSCSSSARTFSGLPMIPRRPGSEPFGRPCPPSSFPSRRRHSVAVSGVGKGRSMPSARTVVGEGVLEVREQFGELLRESVGGRLPTIALQRKRSDLVGSGGPPDAEVDSAREQGFEDRERLGDLERAVVRE